MRFEIWVDHQEQHNSPENQTGSDVKFSMQYLVDLGQPCWHEAAGRNHTSLQPRADLGSRQTESGEASTPLADVAYVAFTSSNSPHHNLLPLCHDPSENLTIEL